MFYLFEILGVFLQNTIIFGGFRASSWGILKISSGNTVRFPSRRIVLLYLAHCGLGHKRLLHVL
jgi:hypothetical protein